MCINQINLPNATTDKFINVHIFFAKTVFVIYCISTAFDAVFTINCYKLVIRLTESIPHVLYILFSLYI